MPNCENCGIEFHTELAEQWTEFVGMDDKVYKVHPHDLEQTQERGLIKKILGKVPFSPTHCDLCCSMLAAVCLPHFRRAQEEFEVENLLLAARKQALLSGGGDDED